MAVGLRVDVYWQPGLGNYTDSPGATRAWIISSLESAHEHLAEVPHSSSRTSTWHERDVKQSVVQDRGRSELKSAGI